MTSSKNQWYVIRNEHIKSRVFMRINLNINREEIWNLKVQLNSQLLSRQKIKL